MSGARLRVDQQIIAGLLKDRHFLLEQFADSSNLFEWARVKRENMLSEIRIIDKKLDEIASYYMTTTTGATPTTKDG